LKVELFPFRTQVQKAGRKQIDGKSKKKQLENKKKQKKNSRRQNVPPLPGISAAGLTLIAHTSNGSVGEGTVMLRGVRAPVLDVPPIPLDPSEGEAVEEDDADDWGCCEDELNERG
jgi:hypothetical protein